MNINTLSEHRCADKCTDFKATGEQCSHCLISSYPEILDNSTNNMEARHLISSHSEIPNSSDYAVGDTVVFINPSKPDHLMTVTQVQKNSVLLDGNSNFTLNHLIRHANAVELISGKRLPKGAIFIGIDLGLAPGTAYIKKDQENWEHSKPYAELMTAKQTWQEQQRQIELLKAENLSMSVELNQLKEALNPDNEKNADSNKHSFSYSYITDVTEEQINFFNEQKKIAEAEDGEDQQEAISFDHQADGAYLLWLRLTKGCRNPSDNERFQVLVGAKA